ncbi:MAG: tRNA (cytidine(34)-2'-O)-methyltransferase [Rickettsiales bacterium]|nr:tRNA (cytidine(34)-2'-O)-methyltransferase [Rickettsiales bacterium]
MLIALFQPDIPQNLGSLIRLCACLRVGLHIIEPCGFPLDDKRMKRAAMDYYDLAAIERHASWEAFLDARQSAGMGRLVLLTTKASQEYTQFAFRPDDVLVLGRESAGVPDFVHEAADARLVVKTHPPARSLNLAQAASMVTGEALRQTNSFYAG